MAKKKITKQGEQKTIPAGGVWLLTIRHDPWCSIFKGGACDCHPEVDEPERLKTHD